MLSILIFCQAVAKSALKNFIGKRDTQNWKDQIVKVKILGNGKIKNPLIMKLPCSKGVVKQIEAAGGKIDMEKTAKKMNRILQIIKDAFRIPDLRRKILITAFIFVVFPLSRPYSCSRSESCFFKKIFLPKVSF